MPEASTPSFRPTLVGLALATAFVAAALLITLLLGRVLVFAFFIGAVLLSSWFGGTGAGVFAMLLSIAVLTFVLAGPAVAFGSKEAIAEFRPRIITFTVTSLALMWFSAARKKAEHELLLARDQLEERVRERTASLVAANEQLQAEMDERKRAAVSLVRTKRRARERLLETRFEAILEERTRLAREIHDTLLQGFTGVSLQLLATIGRFDVGRECGTALKEVLALAQKTLADARQAVWEIRPSELEHGNFPALLGAAVDRTVAPTPLVADYSVRGVPRPLKSEVEVVLLRVALEAVTNVLKHAEAETVRVVLSFRTRSVQLVVADDGHGFVVEPDLRSYAGRWGLLGMRERASQLHGKLQVRSAPGSGTKVVLRIPTPPQQALPDRGIVQETAGSVL